MPTCLDMCLRHGQNMCTMILIRIGKHRYMCCEMAKRVEGSDWRVPWLRLLMRLVRREFRFRYLEQEP